MDTSMELPSVSADSTFQDFNLFTRSGVASEQVSPTPPYAIKQEGQGLQLSVFFNSDATPLILSFEEKQGYLYRSEQYLDDDASPVLEVEWVLEEQIYQATLIPSVHTDEAEWQVVNLKCFDQDKITHLHFPDQEIPWPPSSVINSELMDKAEVYKTETWTFDASSQRFERHITEDGITEVERFQQTEFSWFWDVYLPWRRGNVIED